MRVKPDAVRRGVLKWCFVEQFLLPLLSHMRLQGNEEVKAKALVAHKPHNQTNAPVRDDVPLAAPANHVLENLKRTVDLAGSSVRTVNEHTETRVN